MALFGKRKARKLLEQIDKMDAYDPGLADRLELLEQDAVPPLIQRLSSTSPATVKTVDAVLVNLAEFSIIPLIHSLAADHPEVQMRAHCLLKTIGEPTVMPLIRETVVASALHKSEGAPGDEQEAYIQRQVQLLGDLGRPAVIALLEVFAPENEALRDLVGAALHRIGDDAIQIMLPLLKDETPGMRRTVITALGFIEAKDTLDHIVITLGDEDADVRHQAAWALGQLEEPAAISPLIDAAVDPEPEVRAAIIEALGMIGGAEVMTTVIDALDDEDWAVRDTAAWALGQLAPPDACPALIKALSDDHPKIRCTAASALGISAIDAALEPLLTALDDPDVEVRHEVVTALSAFETEPVTAALREVLKRDDEDFLVTNAAEKVLKSRNA